MRIHYLVSGRYDSIMHWLMTILLVLSAQFGMSAEKAGQAQLGVSSHHEDLTAKKKQVFLTVKNHGDGVGYVKMDVHKIVMKDGQRTRVVIKDPRKLGLLVTPGKMVLKPGQSRKVRMRRLIFNNPHDLVYEVNAVPVKPPQKSNKKTVMSVSITMVTFTRVVSRPAKLEPKLMVNRDQGEVNFDNQGNTTVLIRNLRQCHVEPCEKLYGFYLIPGMHRTIHLADANAVLSYSQEYPGKKIDKTI
ncbi:hypothetical protein N9Y17_04880 [Gammaproteobacteria bacterium]|nr:hypothetical protein [Gammaproteobacteria bacterium]